MTMWKDLLFMYSGLKGRWAHTLNELLESPACSNEKINRRLKMESLKEVLKWMVEKKFADWADKNEQDKVFIYWKSPAEIA